MTFSLDELVEVDTTPRPKSLLELLALYKASDWYAKLAPDTAKYYDYTLQMLRTSAYAPKPIEYITPKVALAIYKSLNTQHGAALANRSLSVFGRVFSYAVKEEWIEASPFRFVEKDTLPARTTLWTKKQIMDTCAVAASNDYLHVSKGIMLMYETGQRPKDVLAMTFDDLQSDKNGNFITVTQSKTGTVVCPAISPYLFTLLTLNQASEGFLVGKDIRLVDFRRHFRKVAELAGLPNELQLRDIRRTAITEASRGGATQDQMKGMSGHKSRVMLDRYSVVDRQHALDAFKAREDVQNSKGVS